MALNLKARGETIGPLEKEYSWKDVVLYALGVGAGFEELEYVYEKDLKVLPTFSIAAIFDFLIHMWEKSKINPAGLLHGEQEIEFHRPIPTEGSFITTGSITNFYDMGKRGALVVGTSSTRNKDGELLFTSKVTLVARLDGDFGGEPPPKKEIHYPSNNPNFVIEETPSPNQPLLYRLSGDLFPLHVDPEFARGVGFEQPIMHGLCTLGFACRACIKAFIPGRPERVKKISCRFSRPLYPGTPIKVLIWRTGKGKALYRVINAQTQEIVLDRGEFEWQEEERTPFNLSQKKVVLLGEEDGLFPLLSRKLSSANTLICHEIPDKDEIQGAVFSCPPPLLFSPIEEIPPDTWKETSDKFLKNIFEKTKKVFEKMKDKKRGRIVYLISPLGFHPKEGYGLAASLAMGLLGFINTLKDEGDRYNIKVNAVCPMIYPYLPEKKEKEEKESTDIAEATTSLVLYLLSDRCSFSGDVYLMSQEEISRVILSTGKGVVIKSSHKIPQVEDIRDHIEEIIQIQDPKTYNNLGEQLMDLLSCIQQS